MFVFFCNVSIGAGTHMLKTLCCFYAIFVFHVITVMRVCAFVARFVLNVVFAGCVYYYCILARIVVYVNVIFCCNKIAQLKAGLFFSQIRHGMCFRTML